MAVMSQAALRDVCKKLKLYTTPALNDKLYLHYKVTVCLFPCAARARFALPRTPPLHVSVVSAGRLTRWVAFCARVHQGYSRIENLEAYTGLKVLWLEGNGLARIEGLDAQVELSTLYLQENIINRIENIGHLVNLSTLNLCQVRRARACVRSLRCWKPVSVALIRCGCLWVWPVRRPVQNSISVIENLGGNTSLQTLLLGNNRVTFAGVAGVLECPSITCLDLQHNCIEDAEVRRGARCPIAVGGVRRRASPCRA
jgi:hypothetical protein